MPKKIKRELGPKKHPTHQIKCELWEYRSLEKDHNKPPKFLWILIDSCHMSHVPNIWDVWEHWADHESGTNRYLIIQRTWKPGSDVVKLQVRPILGNVENRVPPDSKA